MSLGGLLLAVVLGECGGGTPTDDTRTPEAKAAAKVEVEPSPTNESPKAEPTIALIPVVKKESKPVPTAKALMTRTNYRIPSIF